MLELEIGGPFGQTLSPPPMENGWTGDTPVVSVRLRFSPAFAYRVYDEFDEGCVTRRADGSLEVAVSFPEDPWLYGYLLSFGLGVEVLERRKGGSSRDGASLTPFAVNFVKIYSGFQKEAKECVKIPYEKFSELLIKQMEEYKNG